MRTGLVHRFLSLRISRSDFLSFSSAQEIIDELEGLSGKLDELRANAALFADQVATASSVSELDEAAQDVRKSASVRCNATSFGPASSSQLQL